MFRLRLRLCSTYSLALVAFAVKNCGSAEDVVFELTIFYLFLITSAEVNLREVCKQVTNSSFATFGVAMCCHTATSERGRGWVGYLPSGFNARSKASEHALATERRKRQGCGVVYLHKAPICTLAIPTSIASGTYRRLVLHL